MKQILKYDNEGKLIETVMIEPVSFLYYTSDDKEFDIDIDAIEYQKLLNPELKIKALPIYEIPENCTEKELPMPNYQPKFDKELDDWVETITQEELDILTGNSLEKLKENKINELNLACNQTILGKFQAEVNGTIYMFSHDGDAQNNFKDAKLSFMDGTIETQMNGAIPWTAYDLDENVVRLLLTKEMFDPVYIARLHHIQNNISKFRDYLQPIVENAESIEEIEQIEW